MRSANYTRMIAVMHKEDQNQCGKTEWSKSYRQQGGIKYGAVCPNKARYVDEAVERIKWFNRAKGAGEVM